MSQYKPYPKYKDSGVEWLGKVPEHWSIKRLRFVALIQNSNVDKKSYENQQNIVLCNYTDVYYNERITPSLEFMPSTASKAEIERFSLLAGDVIITKDSEEADDIGIPAYVPQNLPGIVCGYHLTMLRSHGIEGEFLFRLLQAQPTKAYFLVEVSGVTRFGLGQDTIGNIAVPIPSLEEQKEICYWINRETTHIDTLISKKTRFIELLREKRQALITHAVTKGLDANVKMKDSGVEWLGEVPEHWVVCKLSFRYSIELGKMLDEKKITGSSLIPYLRNQDVQWDTINTEELPVMDIYEAEQARYTVNKGDLLVCEGGDVGRSAIWRGINKKFGFQKALHRLRPRLAQEDTAEFLFFTLLTAKNKGVFEESDSKATISHLPAEKFRQYRFVFPPLIEQAKIVDYIRTRSTRIDTLISKTQHSIDLLKERRAALITAAVTGQIDVRETA